MITMKATLKDEEELSFWEWKIKVEKRESGEKKQDTAKWSR